MLPLGKKKLLLLLWWFPWGFFLLETSSNNEYYLLSFFHFSCYHLSSLKLPITGTFFHPEKCECLKLLGCLVFNDILVWKHFKETAEFLSFSCRKKLLFNLFSLEKREICKVCHRQLCAKAICCWAIISEKSAQVLSKDREFVDEDCSPKDYRYWNIIP